VKKAILALLPTAVFIACSGGSAPSASKVVKADCDRACLEKLIDAVMTGMTSHSAANLSTTPGFRYVENNQTLKPGDGSWQTLESFGPYKHYFADPESGNAAVIAVMRENGSAGLFTLRIRAEGKRLAEAEAIVTHDPRGAANYEKLGKVADAWLEAVPADERMTREELAATANKYFGSMENNDGKGDYSFFADDCNRLEHGLKTTNNTPQNYGHSTDAEFVTLGCRGQFETGFLGFVTRIRDRRYEVIDVERGAVFGIAGFDHNGTLRNIPLTNGKNFKVPTYFSGSRTLQVGEAFRARDGKIKDIEMTLHEFPYGMRTGFRSTFDPSNEVPGGQVPDAKKRCDRGCLEGSLDQLIAAMVDHNPKRAPLADQVRYTENDQHLGLYDGLWGTLTEVGSYRVRVVDPSRGLAVFVGRVTETDLPGILTLRVRVIGGRINEIEATIVREERPGADELFRPRQPVEAEPAALTRAEPLLTQLLPEKQRADRSELVALVDGYLDALEGGKGGDVAFSADCSRHENGVLVTKNSELPRPPAKGRDAAETAWSVAATAPEVPAAPFRPYSLDCTAQLASGYSAYIARARDRRILLVDEDRGLVVSSAYLDIPGTVKQVTGTDGGTINLPPVLGRPYTLAATQLFKIEGGQIRRIEQVDKVQPYGARAAWTH
jgi:hypothetical protein